MKNFYYLISLSILISCGNKSENQTLFSTDETPKCDDTLNIGYVKNMLASSEIYASVLYEKLYKVSPDEELEKAEDNTEYKKEYLKRYRELMEHCSNYREGKTEDIPENILKLIEKEIEKFKVENRIENIRIVNIDEISKKCECEIDWIKPNNEFKTIIYSAQKNSEGDVNIEIY